MRKLKYKIVLGISFLFIVIQASLAQGSRYAGEYKKSNPVRYDGVKNIVIEGLDISNGSTDGIALYNSENVVIRNSRISSSPSKRGVYLFNCKNITIEDCTFEDLQSALLASTSQGVKFQNNDVLNVVGMLNEPFETGSMVQFIQVTGSGNSISYNVCENISGKSAPEDIVNIYASHGTANSPITIKGNWIRGGEPSKSGGGINIGDYGGSYQVVEDNILVNPGMYGVGVSGGNNMTLRNNKVYGKGFYFNNVGMTVYNWYEKEAGASYNITAANNRINYTHGDGYVNNWWIPDNKGIVSGVETNIFDKSISPSILPDKILGRARDNAPVVPPTDPDDGNNNGGGSEPETPELTPPPIGGGDGNGSNKPGTGPEVDPNPDEVFDPSITIYLDRFKRICINTRGGVQRDSNVSVYNINGELLHSQRLRGYHTVIRRGTVSGTYEVRVKNGDRLKNQQLIIK